MKKQTIEKHKKTKNSTTTRKNTVKIRSKKERKQKSHGQPNHRAGKRSSQGNIVFSLSFVSEEKIPPFVILHRLFFVPFRKSYNMYY